MLTYKTWCRTRQYKSCVNKILVLLSCTSTKQHIRVLLGKVTVPQPVKKFPAFYGNRRFITAFTSARHLSLSWVRSIHPSHPTSWRSILISSPHLRIGHPSGLFASSLPIKIPYVPFLHPIRTTYRAHVMQIKVRKVKWSRYRPGIAQRVGRGIALLFHDRGTRRGEWSAARPGRTLPPGKTR